MSDYRQNGRCRKFYSEPKTNRILYVTDCREIVGSAKFSKENREKCSEYFRRNLSPSFYALDIGKEEERFLG